MAATSSRDTGHAHPPARRARALALVLGGVGALALAAAAALLITGETPGGMLVQPLSRESSSDATREAPGIDPNAPTVRSLDDLREQYGEPPDALYGRIRIPAIDVDAPLSRRTVGADGQMANPSGPSDVAWYDFVGWPSLGGEPGAGRNAVFAGHVDRNAYLDYAGVNYFGPGIFYGLRRLDEGDTIEVTYRGKTIRYAVAWRRDLSPSSGDWDEVFSADVSKESITLVTCSGDFDARTQEYRRRTVVRAVRA